MAHNKTKKVLLLWVTIHDTALRIGESVSSIFIHLMFVCFSLALRGSLGLLLC